MSLVEARETEVSAPSANEEQAGRVYRIQDGDTLGSIAGQEYNDSTQWRVIALANDLKDVVNLNVGDELKIPDLA